MALKKQHFAEGEIAIFDEACIYKRGEYWQFRMWLPKENKYARKSLRTRSEATAIEKGKAAYLEIYANLQQGKSYFSITTKEGVEKYLSFRMRDVELGHIVKGRHTTIATHLQHYGRCMTATEQHTQLAKRFIELSEQCHQQINSDAVGWWKDEVRV